MTNAEARRRASAALRGLAVGDALGAATEGYRPEEVENVYDAPITELTEPVNLYPESEPDRARAEVGPVTRAAIAGGRRLLGAPGGLIDGDALGWAVPVGIITAAGPVEPLVEAATAFATGEARAAGAAVAAAVAAGIGGFMARDTVAQATLAAVVAGCPALAHAIIRATGIGQASGGRLVGAQIAAECPPGPGPAAAVAFAFGVAFGAQSVRRAMLEAVNQGGESSLTAALVGALCGSFAPATTVETWASEVETANGLNLDALAERLLARRPPPPEAVEMKRKKKR